MHIFASIEKTTYHHKNEYSINMDITIAQLINT
jgi:hypothetical protein